MAEILSLWNLSSIAFIILIIYLIWRDRKNIERHGIIFVRRTKKGLEIIDKIANFSPEFWKFISTIGIFIGFLVSIFTFFYLVFNIINSFIAVKQPGLALVLPTISTEFKLMPGLFLMPFWYWIISIFFVILVHEGMHGIIGRAEKFRINSVGWAIIGILPAAFVEPEGEKNIHSKKDENKDGKLESIEGTWYGGTFLSRLRVIAAGSLGNLLFAAIIGILLLLITTNSYGIPGEIKGIYEHNGVRILKIMNNSPAQEFGLPENVTIVEINGKKIKSIVDFRKVMREVKPNLLVELKDKNNITYFVVASEYPENNLSYSPKVRDYIFAYIERLFPVIEYFEKLDPVEVKIARWNWIKENFDFLRDKSEERLSFLKNELKNKPYLGVIIVNDVKVKEGVKPFLSLILFFINILSITAIINLGIGMANLLPLKPLDGGLLWEELFRKYVPKKSTILMRFLNSITLLVILMSFAVNFI